MTFYKDKKVLVTGHTGFKGSWMVAVLLMAGAKITGYALEPPTDPSLFELLGLNGEDNVPVRPFENCPGELVNIYADIRNLDELKETFAEAQPEIVIHMAAQPLVRSSYKDPVYTFVCYLGVAAGQYMDPSVEGCYNVGPDDKDALSTAKIATMFCDNWNSFALKTAAGAESNKNTSEKIAWINKSDGGPHEDKYLKLDCTRIKERLGWHPLWDADRTMRELVKWYKAYSIDSDLKSVTKQQVEDYLECLSSWTDFDTNSNI